MLRRRKKMWDKLRLQQKGRKLNKFFLTALIIIIQTAGSSQINTVEAFPELTFTSPVDLQHAGDGTNRVFVVEQEGVIKVFENSHEVTEYKEFLNITDRVKISGEMGLLGLAFHPDYANNGYFFVNYTTDEPRDRSIISRFQVTSDPDLADRGSELRLIRLNQPRANHNGGQIAFGPDGYLYIAFGDGGGAGDPDDNGQDRSILHGKILRIDVDNQDGELNYAVPGDNPFKNNTLGYREEIFAFGFRNPWRFSFDRITGNLWVADVGQGDYEEINLVEAGGNYGWSLKEGSHCFRPSSGCEIPGLIDPVYEYSHAQNIGNSITGGYVYRGSALPQLYGKYIYGDFVSSNIWALEYDGINQPVNELLTTAPGNITSFGTDQNEELFILTFGANGGKIYKLNSLSDADDLGSAEMGYILREAYPNPFNPSTSFSFHVPEESDVKIDIISVTGELITSFKNEIYQAGNYELTWDAGDLSSGIYFIRMTAVSTFSTSTYDNTIKVVLLK
jgi:glucose/arabinose dehydrogenase